MKTSNLTNGTLTRALEEAVELLKLEMNLRNKYNVTKLANTIKDNLKTFNKLREKLVKEYAEENEKGETVIKIFEDEDKKEVSEKYKEFVKKLNEIAEEKTEIKFKPLTLGLFDDLKTDKNFPTLFSEFTVEDEESK